MMGRRAQSDMAIIVVLALLVTAFVGYHFFLKTEPLPTAPNVDLDMYTGKWYATHHIPTFFEEGCNCTTATYLLTADDTLIVKNTCETAEGLQEAYGEATLQNPNDPTRLTVQFEDAPPFELFGGDYYIIDVARDYRFAIVGSPDRDTLWFLSRNTTLDQDDLVSMQEYAYSLGFDTDRLVPIEQTGCSA